jgi:ureidoglycolate dehydrogenase (NAD+)
MEPASAETAAGVLATADEMGVSTHGVKLLAGYLRRLKAGGIKPGGRPHVTREGPAWALVDGDSSLGALIGVFAMRVAVSKARASGIAYVGVRNGGHFAAVGCYRLIAARDNLVGISVANDTPSVVAPGSRRPVLGTNPFSYAIPAARHPPILLDMATSTVAGGKVYQARMLGKPIPDNWIVTLDGTPTTDAQLYPEGASLVPAAGHKGFGLALLIEGLAALLSGAAATSAVGSWMQGDPASPTEHGAAFIAVDPSVFGPRSEFLERVDRLIEEIHAAPPVKGGQPIMVPGEREFAHQAKVQREGLVPTSDVAQNVLQAAAMAGLDLKDYL